MGFLSWDCLSCGHPLLSHDETNEVNHWMEKGVVLRPNGPLVPITRVFLRPRKMTGSAVQGGGRLICVIY